MVVYNWTGGVVFILAAAVGFGVGYFTGWPNMGLLAAGVTAIVPDLALRVIFRRRWVSRTFWLWSPASGGHMSFVPVWVIGLVVGGFGLYLAATEPPPKPPVQPVLPQTPTLNPDWFTLTLRQEQEPQGRVLAIHWNQPGDLTEVRLDVAFHVDHGEVHKVYGVRNGWFGNTEIEIDLKGGPPGKITSLRIQGQAYRVGEKTSYRIELNLPGVPLYEPGEKHD
jgi:hypothetical protein